MTANRRRVLITRRWPKAVETALRSRYDLVVDHTDRALSDAELSAAFDDFDAVCPTVTDRLTAAIIGPTPRRARMLGNFGVGYSHIDIEAARGAGITVTNTPDVLTDCTADLTMTLLLMLARRAGEGERIVRRGAWTGWRPTQLLGRQVSGKTLGIIGFGRIGQAVARRAHAGFNMTVVFHNRSAVSPDIAAGCGATALDSVEAVLECADFVTLHCPGGAGTRHLIDATRLARMRPGTMLVNTARGEVVDQSALIEALVDGRLAGAGLDVYDDEPAVPDALKTMDKVVLLPHLGSATEETRTAMGMRVVANLDAFFAGELPPDTVT